MDSQELTEVPQEPNEGLGSHPTSRARTQQIDSNASQSFKYSAYDNVGIIKKKR
jgi:hypothetical protein